MKKNVVLTADMILSLPMGCELFSVCRRRTRPE